MNLLEQKNGPAKIEPEYFFTTYGRKISFANGLYWRSFYPVLLIVTATPFACRNFFRNKLFIHTQSVFKNPVEINTHVDWNGNLLERIKSAIYN